MATFCSCVCLINHFVKGYLWLLLWLWFLTLGTVLDQELFIDYFYLCFSFLYHLFSEELRGPRSRFIPTFLDSKQPCQVDWVER